MIRPGKISKDYIKGWRISSTNPFSFLLSLAILYFLLLNFTGNFKEWDQYDANQNGDWIKEDGSLSFDSDFGVLQVKDREELVTTLDSLKITESFANSDSILLSYPQKHF